MEFKNKLTLSRKRVKWAEFISSDSNLSREFLSWRLKHKYKIRSLNRLGYIFLKSEYGMDLVKELRRCGYTSYKDLCRIAKTPWIKFPEEDD